jgi:hypothetical protein
LIFLGFQYFFILPKNQKKRIGWFFKRGDVIKLVIKEEVDMSKAKGRKDISPGKKPGPLTKKERKERKRKRKEKHPK